MVRCAWRTCRAARLRQLPPGWDTGAPEGGRGGGVSFRSPPIIACIGDERSTPCSEAEGDLTNAPPAIAPEDSALSLNDSPMMCDRPDAASDAELGRTRPPCRLGGPAGGSMCVEPNPRTRAPSPSSLLSLSWAHCGRLPEPGTLIPSCKTASTLSSDGICARRRGLRRPSDAPAAECSGSLV